MIVSISQMVVLGAGLASQAFLTQFETFWLHYFFKIYLIWMMFMIILGNLITKHF